MNLNDVRLKHGLTRQDVAGLLELKATTINTYCSDNSPASQEQAVKLDALINNVYDAAADKLGYQVKETSIKILAKNLITRGIHISDVADGVFAILGE